MNAAKQNLLALTLKLDHLNRAGQYDTSSKTLQSFSKIKVLRPPVELTVKPGCSQEDLPTRKTTTVSQDHG